MTTSARNRLFDEQKDETQRAPCVYCGDLFTCKRLTIDHVVPRSRGGTRARTNIVLACWACNGTKGSHDEATFRAWLTTPEGRTWLRSGTRRRATNMGLAAPASTRHCARSLPMDLPSGERVLRSRAADAPASEDWRSWPRGGRDGE